MAVAAHNGHARLGNAQLWSYHVYNPLVRVVQTIEGYAVFLAVLGQLVHLKAGKFVANRLILINGRYVVVRGGHRAVGAEYLQSACIQSGKSLRTGHFMDQVLVDVHHTWAIFDLLNYVGVPDLIE